MLKVPRGIKDLKDHQDLWDQQVPKAQVDQLDQLEKVVKFPKMNKRKKKKHINPNLNIIEICEINIHVFNFIGLIMLKKNLKLSI